MVEVEPALQAGVDREGRDDVSSLLHVDDNVATSLVGQGGLTSAGGVFEEANLGACDGGVLLIGRTRNYAAPWTLHWKSLVFSSPLVRRVV